LYGQAAHEIAVQLAWHYVEADIVEKAVHYLQQAGEQAAARFANEEAAAYFSRALDLLPGSESARRFSLILAREQVYHLQGNREGQIRDLEDLGELAGALDDGGQAAARRRAEVAVRRARYAQATADYGEAVGAAQATITHALAAAAGDLEAEGHLRWGKALWNQSDYEAGRSQLRRALDLARTSGLRRLEADALDNLGQICWRQGDYDGARAHEDAALPIYREIGQRRGEGMTLSHLGILAWEVGDLEGATDYLEQSLRIYREMGYRLGEGRALGNLGGVYHHQGRFDEARNYLEQALPIAREAGDRQAEADILGNLAAFAVDLGDLEGARESQEQVLDLYRALGDRGGEGIMHANLSMLLHYLGAENAATEHNQQAMRIARDLGDPFTEAYALTFRGHALAHGGQLAGAEAAYRQALDLWRESGQHNLAMEAQAGLAAVLLAQDDTGQALAQVEEILAHLQTGSLDGTAEPFRVYLSCYHVLRAGKDPRARELLADAHRQLQERAARIADEATRRSFLENIPSHRELVGLWHSQQ
jgi:tetratricopeptide (TPR) repeat protein